MGCRILKSGHVTLTMPLSGRLVVQRLKLKDHCLDKIDMLGLIKRNFNLLCTDSFVMLYKSNKTMVRWHLEYANAVWVQPSQRRVNKRSRKSIDESNETGVWIKKKSYKKRLVELKLPTLKYRRISGNMIEVYTLLTDITDKYDDNTVHLHTNIESRTRGHTKKLIVKRCHYDVWKYSFCIRVVNTWNSLHNDVITATSVNSFKNRLDLFWADQEVSYNYSQYNWKQRHQVCYKTL